MHQYVQQYHVVYDFRHDWFVFGWLSIAIAVSMTIAGASFLWRAWQKSSPFGSRDRMLIIAYCGFAIAADATVIPMQISTFVNNRRALDAQRFVLVQGVVEHFVSPVPGTKGWAESFDVAGHHYSYSSNGPLSGFHRTQSQGGPVGAGAHVRIADRDGIILRLEILQ
jgi:hypothetical protein